MRALLFVCFVGCCWLTSAKVLLVSVTMAHNRVIYITPSAEVKGYKDYPALTINRRFIRDPPVQLSLPIGTTQKFGQAVLALHPPFEIDQYDIYDGMKYLFMYVSTANGRKRNNPYYGLGLNITWEYVREKKDNFHVYRMYFVKLEDTPMAEICLTRNCLG